MPKSGWRKLLVRSGGDPPPDLVQLTAGVMEQRGYAVANDGWSRRWIDGTGTRLNRAIRLLACVPCNGRWR